MVRATLYQVFNGKNLKKDKHKKRVRSITTFFICLSYGFHKFSYATEGILIEITGLEHAEGNVRDL